MLSFLIHTLGCKLNQLESEALIDAFRQAGFVLHNDSAQAAPSIVIINTCTVTSKADQKARRVIRKALRDYPDSCVIVTGCYARLEQERIKELGSGFAEDRLFVFNGKDKSDLLDFLPRTRTFGTHTNEEEEFKAKVRRTEGTHVPVVRGKISTAFQFAPERFSGHTRSFLKIQDGCNKHCTYCRIRLARGPNISLPAAQALARLRVLEENHAEAVLTGVNITQYCDESGRAGSLTACGSLAELLEYLLAGTTKINLRLSSLAPDCIDKDLAGVLSNKRIRPHFHLSIQSGSEIILEKMGRNYNFKTIEQAVSLLRRAKDDPFLACDIITGFPGETEVEFEKTYELCKKTGFAWIHVFPYSKRPGTPAWSFKGRVHEAEVSKRVQMLTLLARQGRQDYVKRWLGKELEVLIEKGTRSYCRGISENYLKLLVQYIGQKAPHPGEVLRCKLSLHQDAAFIEDFDAVAQELGKNFEKK